LCTIGAAVRGILFPPDYLAPAAKPDEVSGRPADPNMEKPAKPGGLTG
jgi:hypothetical protein